MSIKSFKGRLKDSHLTKISLGTADGSTGYRITKFRIMSEEPGTASVEHVVKIYKTEQTTVTGTVNFGDNTLIGAAFLTLSSGAGSYGNSGDVNVIFDNEVFNQDIWVTHEDNSSAAKACNFYIELESMKLDLNENTVVTLKDIRNTNSQ